MEKQLIYMGFNGVTHRVGLFDPNNPMAGSIPIRDTPILPEKFFMNCRVVDGKPYPNIDGIKVAMTHGKDEPHAFKCGWNLKLGRDVWKLEDPRFRVFPDEPVKYNYGIYDGIEYVYNVPLLGAFKSFKFWDGSFSPSNVFVISMLAMRKNSKRGTKIPCIMCITSEGEKWFLSESEILLCNNDGLRFIQAGTTVLKHPFERFEGLHYVKNPQPMLYIGDSGFEQLIWQGRKDGKMPNDPRTVEYVCWTTEYRAAICDLRKYSNARVFGAYSVFDSSAVIFPESAEDVWMTFMKHCPSVKSVYLPANIKKLYEYGIPVRRIKGVTLYTNSPVVQEFANRMGAKCVSCSSADEFFSEFYAASDDEYISVDTAGSIAALAGAASSTQGESRTVMSGILFSIESKGFAFEEIENNYPVTPSEKTPLMQELSFEDSEDYNTISDGSPMCLARTRLLAAAFTLFYPKATFEVTPDLPFKKYVLGYYNVYVYSPYQSKKNTPSPRAYGVRKSEPKPTKPDAYVLLEDAQSRKVIHRFIEYSENIVGLLHYMLDVCFYGEEPSGVLRYADKLQVLYNWYRQGSEQGKINIALFNTFLPIMYGSKRGKSELVGICTHTGGLATARFTAVPSSSYQNRYYHSRGHWFPRVNRLSNIMLHSGKADVVDLFDKSCSYRSIEKEAQT